MSNNWSVLSLYCLAIRRSRPVGWVCLWVHQKPLCGYVNSWRVLQQRLALLWSGHTHARRLCWLGLGAVSNWSSPRQRGGYLATTWMLTWRVCCAIPERVSQACMPKCWVCSEWLGAVNSTLTKLRLTELFRWLMDLTTHSWRWMLRSRNLRRCLTLTPA